MQLLEIHIYGYGKLENVQFSLADLNVFFGENEAGKSTIMSFIHSILFGFPTKQQTELRYEPKSGGKYGGKLIVFFPKHGKGVIERVKGRAVGDVTVHLEDGTFGGDQLLQQLLGNIDKSFYQSIFSFNLHGLQNVHLLKAEEVGRFLFSTGTFGTGLLMRVEDRLQKEIGDRFKPTGRKPIINEQLKVIKESFNELKKHEEHNLQYVSLNKEKQSLQEKMAVLKTEWHSLQERKKKLEEWVKLAPIVKEREYLANELNNENIHFPQDGIERLNQFNELIHPLMGDKEAVIEKQGKLQEQLQTLKPNYTLLQEEYAINQLGEQQPLMKMMDEEIIHLHNKLSQNSSQIEQLQEKLHLSLSNDDILAIDTSIFMEKEVEEGERKRLKLIEKHEELEEQGVKKKNALEQLEEQIRMVKNKLIPDDEKSRLLEKLDRLKGKETLEKELELLKDKKQLLKQAALNEKKERKKNKWQQIVLALIFLLLTGYGFIQQEWLLLIVGAVGFVFILFLLMKKSSNKISDWKKQLFALEERERKLFEQLQFVDESQFALINEKLTKNEELEKELQRLEIKLEQLNNEYEHVIQSFEQWEHEFFTHEQALTELRDKLKIPNILPLEHLHTAYQMIAQLKELIRNRIQWQGQLREKQESLQQLKEKISSIYELCTKGQQHISANEMIFSLKESLKEEKRKLQQYEMIQDKLAELEEQKREYEKRLAHLQNERNNLFVKAEVQTEDEFRIRGKEWIERQEKLQKLEQLTKQISLSSFIQEEIGQFSKIADVHEEITGIEKTIKSIKEEEELIYEKLADLNHQIALIEEGGTYGDKLHNYKQLQSELEDEAFAWAKYTVAKELLKRTIDRFQHIRLPKMLARAEEFLQYLTEGNYIKIHVHPSTDAFLIERKDHIFFQGNELSQATMEQVYVAIRLALVDTLYKRFSLPILIDDSFVNFDKERTKRVISLIRQIQGNQILFFTCHEHLLPYFNEDEVIDLKRSVSVNM